MTSTIFMNGRSQAVRIPKEYRFEGKRVTIKRVKEGLLLIPEKSTWQSAEEVFGKADEDFLNQRIQPPLEKRIFGA
jgi:antitoxin VapB